MCGLMNGKAPHSPFPWREPWQQFRSRSYARKALEGALASHECPIVAELMRLREAIGESVFYENDYISLFWLRPCPVGIRIDVYADVRP